MRLESNEPVDAVLGGETSCVLAFTLVNAPDQLVRHAEVERGVLAVSKEVDVIRHDLCIRSLVALQPTA